MILKEIRRRSIYKGCMPKGNMVRRVIQKLCSCGHILKAHSDEVMRMNLSTHKKGRRHIEGLKIKERIIVNYIKESKAKGRRK